MLFSFFFFNDTATTEIYTLSLHDALPISEHEPRADADVPHAAGIRLEDGRDRRRHTGRSPARAGLRPHPRAEHPRRDRRDRKSTRLNSSHSQISYAVFCLKKKKKINRS